VSWARSNPSSSTILTFRAGSKRSSPCALDPERKGAERAPAADGLPRADLDDVRVPVEEDAGEARLADARAAGDEQANGAERRAERGRVPERGGERERRDHERVRARVRVHAVRRVLRACAVRVGRGEDGRLYGREEDDEAGLPGVDSESEPDALCGGRGGCAAGALALEGVGETADNADARVHRVLHGRDRV
jgi:hypothetical protein